MTDLKRIRTDLAKRFIPVMWNDRRTEKGPAHLECVIEELNKVTSRKGSTNVTL